MSSQPTINSHRAPRQISRGAAPMAPPSTPSWWAQPRRLIWTGAFAVVIVACTIYGAGLKVQQEYKAEKKKVLELPIEDRIRELETHRAALVTQKKPLLKKLDELRLRVQKEEEAAAAAAAKNARS